MDGDAFFDDLYAQYCVQLPVFALYRRGRGYASEPAADGSRSLVLLTDADLMDRHRGRHPAGLYTPVELNTPAALRRFLGRLPAGFTHVTFDPQPRFHRRFPVGVLREHLPKVAAGED
jgi:hypothetical protein